MDLQPAADPYNVVCKAEAQTVMTVLNFVFVSLPG